VQHRASAKHFTPAGPRNRSGGGRARGGGATAIACNGRVRRAGGGGIIIIISSSSSRRSSRSTIAFLRKGRRWQVAAPDRARQIKVSETG
jgi:hypothetical protein